MSEKQTSAQIEDLKPRLKGSVERFSLPGGDTGLYEPSTGEYLRVSPERTGLLDALDGQISLTDLAVRSAASGSLRPLPIRTLLALVGDLARGPWLDNDPAELVAVGLETRDPAPGLAQRLSGWLLSWRLASRGLGSVAAATLAPLKVLPTGRWPWIALAILGAVLAGLAAWSGRLLLPEDALELQGHYALGLLAVYLGAVGAFAARAKFRGAVLLSSGVGIFAAGVAVRLFVLSPYLDDRHIFRAGRAGVQRLGLAGISGPALVLGLLLGLAALLDDPIASQALVLAACGAGVVLYAVLCPLAGSDLGRLIDLRMPAGEGRRHAVSYFQRRILRRLVSRSTFEGELQFVAVAALAVLWLHIGFTVGADVFHDLALAAAHLPTRANVNVLDQISLLAVLAGALLLVVSWVVVLVVGILHVLFSHRGARPARPELLADDRERARKALLRFPLFVHLDPAVLEHMLEHAKLLAYRPGHDVFLQGSEGNDFYVVAAGTADVIIAADSGVEHRINTLTRGDGFGELALLGEGRRTATVRATSALELVTIDRDEFLGALDRASVPRESVTTLLHGIHAFHSSDVFGDMQPGALARVIGRCTRELHEAGDVILREGEPGDRFYLIETGAVRVERADQSTPLAELGPGQYFGEMALLTDEPRNATVTCTEPGAMLVLDRQGFHEVMTHDFNAAVQLEATAASRDAALQAVPA